MQKLLRAYIYEALTPEDFEDVYSSAQLAHLGQMRRSGGEYFSHPKAVRNIVRKFYPDDRAAEMVALLHDTLEDAPKVGNIETVEEMESMIGASIGDPKLRNDVLRAVQSLTHDKGMAYADYLIDLADNPLALRVKLADMMHNASSSPSPKQLAKYQNAFEELEQVYAGPPAGVSSQQWGALDATLFESKKKRSSTYGGWPEGEYEPSVEDQIEDYYRDMGLAERRLLQAIIKEMLYFQ